MVKVEQDFSALSSRVHKVYGEWAKGHLKEGLLDLRSYDGDEYYQRPDVAFFEAEPNLELAQNLGRAAMGEAAYQKFADGYDNHHVLEIVRSRHGQGKNTLIPTLHLKDVLDTAMSHNRLFTMTGGGPSIAEINDVIANPMMTRITIADESAIKVLAASGNVDNGLPIDGALEHGMLREDAEYLERLYGSSLGRRLGNKNRTGAGIAVHWALTGTRASEIISADGDKAMSIVRVQDGVAKIVVSRAALAVPVPMDVRLFDCRVEVLKPRELETENDVHKMMEEMAEVASELAGKKIFYGMPKGFTLLPKK
jgi:hypothetical protein